MSAHVFQKATKKKAKLRAAFVSPSGYGKTYTALAVATSLGQRVAVIDSERGSASKYADRFTFDALDLESFEPQQYIDAIHAAAQAGYDVVVIDSLSHAWMGKGGALEQVDNIARKSQSRNSFNAWREVTPQHNALVDAIIRAPLHIIATMRAKTEYVIEKDERGKSMPRKVGIQPVQRDGLEYEFDVVADLDEENNLIIGKTRCDALHGKIFRKAGKDVAQLLLAWLSDGADAPVVARPAPAPASEPTLEKQLAASVDATWPKWLAKHQDTMRNAKTPGELKESFAEAWEEVQKLSPPTEYVDQLKATKDEIKGVLAANGARA